MRARWPRYGRRSKPGRVRRDGRFAGLQAPMKRGRARGGGGWRLGKPRRVTRLVLVNYRTSRGGQKRTNRANAKSSVSSTEPRFAGGKGTLPWLWMGGIAGMRGCAPRTTGATEIRTTVPRANLRTTSTTRWRTRRGNCGAGCTQLAKRRFGPEPRPGVKTTHTQPVINIRLSSRKQHKLRFRQGGKQREPRWSRRHKKRTRRKCAPRTPTRNAGFRGGTFLRMILKRQKRQMGKTTVY
mmetsp:Transcript_10363/g.38467  ORF Transcript_10363/g.38467 Transcript_10363/m.38467 type:complete len:239 (-) Transcript_10363:188-904(-)